MQSQGRETLVKICNTTGRDVAKSERDIIKEDIISSFLNLEDDGIERVKEDNTVEKGYLVLQSTEEEHNRLKHLALKVSNTKFWTISAVNGGSELEIGIIEDGEHRPVISFNEDAALSLNKVLNLGAGLNAIEQYGKPKGIPNSGFKGFKEGRLKASGNWESTNVKIPENTFGKYKLQAWLIQQDENRFSHLETVFIFFPEEHPKQRIKYQSVGFSKLSQIYYQIEKWWLKKILKREVETKAGNWKARMYAKINKENGEILIKCNTVIDPNRKYIHYSIERLWEGENWIENNTK